MGSQSASIRSRDKVSINGFQLTATLRTKSTCGWGEAFPVTYGLIKRLNHSRLARLIDGGGAALFREAQGRNGSKRLDGAQAYRCLTDPGKELVGSPGFEPGTYRLKVRCSTD